MKWLWFWMLVIAYTAWSVASLIDIFTTTKDWIDCNLEDVNDEKNIVPVKRKRWVFNRDFSDLLFDLEGYSKAWIITTIAIIFLTSVVYCLFF